MNHILLVIAHPDDEVMFFYPTISNLMQSQKIHILCLSNGNNDGLGKIREKEFEKVQRMLKIYKFQILNTPYFQDGMTNKWESGKVKEVIQNYVKENNIKAVVSFDDQGVSGHLNHISVYQGMLFFFHEQAEQQQNQKQNQDIAVKFFVLKSVNILRKYIGVLDMLLSVLDTHTYAQFNVIRIWQLMRAYESQFVWFRKLSVVFSRYSYINTLREIQQEIK